MKSEQLGEAGRSAPGIADADLEAIEVHLNGSENLTPDEAAILREAMRKAYGYMARYPVGAERQTIAAERALAPAPQQTRTVSHTSIATGQPSAEGAAKPSCLDCGYGITCPVCRAREKAASNPDPIVAPALQVTGRDRVLDEAVERVRKLRCVEDSDESHAGEFFVIRNHREQLVWNKALLAAISTLKGNK